MDYSDRKHNAETPDWDVWPLAGVAGMFDMDEIPKCPACGRRIGSPSNEICRFCKAKDTQEKRDVYQSVFPPTRSLTPVVNRRILPCNRQGTEGKNLQ